MKHLNWSGPSEFIDVKLPKMMSQGYTSVVDGEQHRALIYKNVGIITNRLILSIDSLDTCVGLNLILSPNESVITTKYVAGLLAIYLHRLNDSSLVRKVIKITHSNPVVVQRAENAILTAWVELMNTKSPWETQISDYLRSLR